MKIIEAHQSWSEEDLRGALDEYEVQLRAAGKARNTITTYVQHPERFINWLVGQYKLRPATKVRSESSGTNEPTRPRSSFATRDEPKATWELVLVATRRLTETGPVPFGLADIIAQVQQMRPELGRTSIQPVVQGMTSNAGAGPQSPCGEILERVYHGHYRLSD